jgi:glucan 1,3-beta-glucosidase
MRIVALVVALVACVHAGLWALSEKKVSAPDIDGPVASMSYAPFQGATHADEAKTSVAQIRSDLRMLARHTRAVRLYSSTGGVDLVPPVAAEVGLKVTAGAWLDTNQQRNEREIRAAIELARRNSNVQAVVVGNEHVMRGEIALLGDEKLTPEENDQIAAAGNAA